MSVSCLLQTPSCNNFIVSQAQKFIFTHGECTERSNLTTSEDWNIGWKNNNTVDSKSILRRWPSSALYTQVRFDWLAQHLYFSATFSQQTVAVIKFILPVCSSHSGEIKSLYANIYLGKLFLFVNKYKNLTTADFTASSSRPGRVDKGPWNKTCFRLSAHGVIEEIRTWETRVSGYFCTNLNNPLPLESIVSTIITSSIFTNQEVRKKNSCICLSQAVCGLQFLTHKLWQQMEDVLIQGTNDRKISLNSNEKYSYSMKWKKYHETFNNPFISLTFH